MELTRQADYAIRCVLEAARHERISAREIAARQELSPSFVGKIISTLARAGILETLRGAAGGVQLGRPPEEISVLDVVQAVQGPIQLNRCVRVPPSCALVELCPVSPVIRDAQDALSGALSVTFDVLLERDRANRAAWNAALAGSSADRPIPTAAGSTGERLGPASPAPHSPVTRVAVVKRSSGSHNPKAAQP